jgi:hypothetical protein
MILLPLILAAGIGATATLALVITFAAGWTLARAGLRPTPATPTPTPASPPTTSDRIILADLRERLRQLEAIAAGIDP